MPYFSRCLQVFLSEHGYEEVFAWGARGRFFPLIGYLALFGETVEHGVYSGFFYAQAHLLKTGDYFAGIRTPMRKDYQEAIIHDSLAHLRGYVLFVYRHRVLVVHASHGAAALTLLHVVVSICLATRLTFVWSEPKVIPTES